jgi:integrase
MSIDRGELLELLIADGYSTKSARVYATAIDQAARGLAPATLDDAAPSVIRAYAETLPKTRGTRALLRSALGAYWRLSERPSPPLGAIRVPTHPRMVCKALSDEDARILARAARRRRDRKGLAVLIGLYVGLRRNEIAELRWSNLTDDGWVRLIGKGDVSAELPLHPIVIDALEGLRPPSLPGSLRGADYVFPGRTGGPVNPTTLWGHVREVSVAAGLRPVPTHVLRHTCLATALDNTRDLRAVQELARHARPETTAGYTRVKRTRMVETVNAIAYEGVG